MGKKAKKICGSVSALFTLIIIVESIFMFSKDSVGERFFPMYVPFIVIALALLACAICVVGLIKDKDFYFKIGILTGFFGAIGVGIYLALELTGVSAMLQNAGNLQDFMDKAGVWAPLVYILIQFAQVTLIPIPSTVTVIAGTMMFDLVEVLIYSTIGMILGSMVAFSLGKIFGVKLVVWLVGEKSFNKYLKLIKGRDKTMLFLMFLFPVFPDDLLCLIAGITTMNYSTFFIMQLISRPIGIFLSSLGGEMLKNIPFQGPYIAIWVAAAFLVVAMFYVVWKYSGRIEEKIIGAITKRVKANSAATVDCDMLKCEVENLVSDTKVVLDELGDGNGKIAVKAPNEAKKISYEINYFDKSA